MTWAKWHQELYLCLWGFAWMSSLVFFDRKNSYHCKNRNYSDRVVFFYVIIWARCYKKLRLFPVVLSLHKKQQLQGRSCNNRVLSCGAQVSVSPGPGRPPSTVYDYVVLGDGRTWMMHRISVTDSDSPVLNGGIALRTLPGTGLVKLPMTNRAVTVQLPLYFTLSYTPFVHHFIS